MASQPTFRGSSLTFAALLGMLTAVACNDPLGPVTSATLRVTVATTGTGAPATYLVGVDPNPSGYQHAAVISSTGTVSIALGSGAHTVTLEVPRNCTVITPNNLSVTMAPGVPTDLTFSVTCVARGTVQVTVATTGADVPATYTVGVDPGSAGYYTAVVPSNGTVSLALASGAHTVGLTVAQNCTVTSLNNVSVTVAPGAPTDLTFRVTCVVDSGTVQVTVATTGADVPATYTVGVDPGSSGYYTAVVPSNGTVAIALASGAHTVSLTVAGNCTVTGPNTVSVTVAPGAPTDITFSVTCVASGSVQVTVATTGPDAPATYSVGVSESSGGYEFSAVVPSNGTVSFALALGTHSVSLGATRNCTVTSSNPVSVTVAAGAPTEIAFSVTCVANGTIRVTVATTGTDAPATYGVQASEIWHYYRYRASIPSNGTISLAVAPGDYSVQLGVPLNCTVNGNTRGVTVASGGTASITFSLTCGPPATLRVTASTTGLNAPATYTVGVDPDRFGYGTYKYSAVISPNGTVSKILPPGSHTVKLRVPLNCTVTSPNNVSVTLTPGATTNLAFTVTCQ